jgi:hypothetical protein
VFDEFGFIDAFGGGGADIAPIAFDSGSIADTAWTPSFDSSMMSPEMAMGSAGGFDQVGPIVNALADAGRFDLIPPFLESAGFDTAGFEGMGTDPLAPLAQTPSEVPSTAWDAEQSAPSLMSLMMQTPQAAPPQILAPWNPMGNLGQPPEVSAPAPTPLIINPEQQFGVEALTSQEHGAQPPPMLSAATGNEYAATPMGAQSFDESGRSSTKTAARLARRAPMTYRSPILIGCSAGSQQRQAPRRRPSLTTISRDTSRTARSRLMRAALLRRRSIPKATPSTRARA